MADEKLKGIACRSVHLAYDAPNGTAFYNEMTIDASVDGTYFMACGWNKGYFGIQELANGKRLVIFSVWDPNSGEDPKKVPDEKRVKILHKDDAVRVGRFGNEGTGGQSFLDFDWKIGTTYRFLVTNTPDGRERNAFAGYFYQPEKQAWTHLVTFSTIAGSKPLSGYYSFVEDFRRNKISTTKARKSHFGNGWVKAEYGDWKAITQSRFTADANPVTNIDAGSDEAGFYLITGGDTQNTTTKLKESIERKNNSVKPPADLPKFDAKK